VKHTRTHLPLYIATPNKYLAGGTTTSALQDLLLEILGKSTESKSNKELQKDLLEQMGSQHEINPIQGALRSLKRFGLVELDDEKARRSGHSQTCFWRIKGVK
jgi:hypothetical protein